MAGWAAASCLLPVTRNSPVKGFIIHHSHYIFHVYTMIISFIAHRFASNNLLAVADNYLPPRDDAGSFENFTLVLVIIPFSH